MNYSFENDTLTVQSVAKVDLAFFYGVTPRQFRNEISDHITINSSNRYTAEEVKKIFKFFGSIPTKADCERAKERISNYLSREKMRIMRYKS